MGYTLRKKLRCPECGEGLDNSMDTFKSSSPMLYCHPCDKLFDTDEVRKKTFNNNIKVFQTGVVFNSGDKVAVDLSGHKAVGMVTTSNHINYKGEKVVSVLITRNGKKFQNKKIDVEIHKVKKL